MAQLGLIYTSKDSRKNLKEIKEECRHFLNTESDRLFGSKQIKSLKTQTTQDTLYSSLKPQQSKSPTYVILNVRAKTIRKAGVKRHNYKTVVCDVVNDCNAN